MMHNINACVQKYVKVKTMFFNDDHILEITSGGIGRILLMVAITYVSVSWVGSMRILKGFYSLKHSQNQKLFRTKMNTTKRLDEKGINAS